MSNLSSYVQTIQLYSSTDTSCQATGLALAVGTTAGSSGTGASTSSPGGFPYFSTGINSSVSLVGVEGIRFTCIPSFYSTGAGSGTSGIFCLQVYASPGTTAPPTAWVAIKDAYAFGYTTGGGSAGAGSTLNTVIQVDVYRPKLSPQYTALSAVVQIPSSSANFVLFADRYGFRTLPHGNSTTYNGQASGAPTTGATVVSANGTT